MTRTGRLSVRIALILAWSLVAAAGGWFVYQYYRVSWALDAKAKLGPGVLIDFAEIAPFPWDNVYFFGPYTSQSQIDEVLGFYWPGASRSSINANKGSNLIVFTKGNKVVHWLDYSRSLKLPRNLPRGYTRAEARFMIRSLKGEDKRLELVDREDAERWAGPPVQLQSFILFDNRNFPGSYALWGRGDRTATIQVFGGPNKSMWEKRYQVKLTLEQWTIVERLVGAQHFMSLVMPRRKGIPDEGTTTIAVVTRSGQKKVFVKFNKDRQPDFALIHDYLLDLCHLADGLQPIYEGEWVPMWHPEGMEFPKVDSD